MEEKYILVTEKYMDLLNDKMNVMEIKYDQVIETSIEKLKKDSQTAIEKLKKETKSPLKTSEVSPFRKANVSL